MGLTAINDFPVVVRGMRMSAAWGVAAVGARRRRALAGILEVDRERAVVRIEMDKVERGRRRDFWRWGGGGTEGSGG
jgi:hypothetical protein